MKCMLSVHHIGADRVHQILADNGRSACTATIRIFRSSRCQLESGSLLCRKGLCPSICRGEAASQPAAWGQHQCTSCSSSQCTDGTHSQLQLQQSCSIESQSECFSASSAIWLHKPWLNNSLDIVTCPQASCTQLS